MEKSKVKHFAPKKDTTTTYGPSSSGCGCGCKGSVPEYEEDDFIIEEEDY